MSRNSDTAILFNGLREDRRKRREKFGIDCPKCMVVQPKRIPTRLLPGQRCKVCGYVDPRSKEETPREGSRGVRQGSPK